MLPSHVAINAVSHSVCGPHNFPSSLKGSRERMPMSWTLYLLWLSTGVLCKTWLKLRNDLSGNDKKIYRKNEYFCLFQAGDICMDIYSKLPENRLIVIYLKWGQCRHCAINVTLYVFFFLFAQFCPLAFYREGLTMWPRQRKHNP